MKRYPVFCQQPETGQYSMMVVAAEDDEDRDLRRLAIAKTWVALGLKWGPNVVFVYKHAGRMWAGTIAASSLPDAEERLAGFARMVAEE